MNIKIGMILLFFFSHSTFAQLLPQVRLDVRTTKVSAYVSNTYGRTMLCEGRVIGLTAMNRTVSAHFRDVIPAGQFRIAYVYTNAYNPFIDARSEIVCR